MELVEPVPDFPYVSGIFPLRAVASDLHGVAKVEFEVDGVVLGVDTSAPYELAWDTRELSDATLTLVVRAYDTSGLEAEHWVGVVVDNTAPVVSISGPSGSVPQAASYGWSLTLSDANPTASSCSLVPAGAPEELGACTYGHHHTATDLPPGSYELVVVGIDAARNRTRATRSFTVVAPSAPPVVSPPAPAPAPEAPETVVDRRPAGKVRTAGTRARVKVAFHATVAGARFECKVDRGRWRACSSVWKPRLSVGRHVLRIRAVAGASIDATPATVKVRVVRG